MQSEKCGMQELASQRCWHPETGEENRQSACGIFCFLFCLLPFAGPLCDKCTSGDTDRSLARSIAHTTHTRRPTMSRHGAVTFKGNPLTLAGEAVKVGQQAPDFTAHYFDAGGLKTLKL